MKVDWQTDRATHTMLPAWVKSFVVRPSFFVLLALPVIFLLVFYCYPLVVVGSVAFAGAAGGLARLGDLYYWRVLWFTTWQAALSTALTLLLALPAAYVVARYRFPGKGLLRAVASVPFVLPTVVVAAAFNALLGPRGTFNTLLQVFFSLPEPPLRLQNTLYLVLLAHVFYNYSVVLRLVGGFWATLDPRIEQAASVLGASRWHVFRTITLPLLGPALGAAALLVFIFCFTSFGVVVILGGPRFATIEVEVYRQTAQLLRLDVAAALSLLQLLCTLLLTLLYTRLVARSRVPLDLRPHGNQQLPRGARAIALVGTTALAVLLLQGTPLLALLLASLGGSTPAAYYRALAENRTGSIFYVAPLTALGNSLLLALATMALALTLGVLAAYLLARRQTTDHSLRASGQEPQTTGDGRLVRARFIAPYLLPFIFTSVDVLFVLPLGTSAVTLGLGYLLAFAGPPLPLRSWPGLLVVVHTLVALPFVVRALLPVLRALDPRLREAAATLGASPLRVLREVDLPLIFPALLVGAAFAFTASLGEFGATILLARPEFPTLPIAIFRLLGQPGELNYGQALALSCILMLATALTFLLLERVRYQDVGEF